MNLARSFTVKVWRNLLLWGVVFAIALTMMALLERQKLIGEFTTKSATLHRLASQRADQHDAHLTSLSAIFVAGGADRKDLLLDVAATINRFYPRILSVNVIPLDPSQAIIPALSDLDNQTADLIREMASQSKGALQISQMPKAPGQYLLVKRSPNTDAARHALVLVIDADALIASEDPFWQRSSVSHRLLTPEGTLLTGTIVPGGAAFSKPLGSASQPLVFETALAIRAVDLLSLRQTLAAVAAISLVFLLILVGLGQRTRAKAAENRANLSAQETRLAHASRVNAMGEMASGMAHELAQPLTAILSQAQAGRHLVRRGDAAQLALVLEDTVTQAQRASDILDRLRRWSKPNRAPPKACSLNDAVRSVDRLLALEVKSVGATINLRLSAEPIFIAADPVELEQVVFNLVRNALDASESPTITIQTTRASDGAILKVSDDGPGIPSALRTRIFEPFVTDKPDGTGLGLALCQRLVEGMNGDLTLLPDAPQTTFRLSLPLSTTQDTS